MELAELRHKAPQPERLKQSLSPPVLETGVRAPGVGRAGGSRGLSPERVDSRLLPVSSQRRPSGYVCVLTSSSSKDPGPMGSGPQPRNLVLLKSPL